MEGQQLDLWEEFLSPPEHAPSLTPLEYGILGFTDPHFLFAIDCTCWPCHINHQDRAFSIENWYEGIKDQTFRAEFLALNVEEAKAMWNYRDRYLTRASSSTKVTHDDEHEEESSIPL